MGLWAEWQNVCLLPCFSGRKGAGEGKQFRRMTVQRIFFAHCNLHPIQLLILAEEIRHTDWCGMKPHFVPHRSSEASVGFCSSPAITRRTTNWHFFPIWNSKQFTPLTEGGWAKSSSTYEPIWHTWQVFFMCVFVQFLHDRILFYDWNAYIYSNINPWP